MRGYVDSGVTYVPLRALLNGLDAGWRVWWDSSAGQAAAESEDDTLWADPAADTLTVNSRTFHGRVTVENGVTYVPLRAVCDALIDTYFTDLREQLIAIDESDPVLRLRRAGIIYREHALDAPGIYALVWMGQASDSAQHCLDAITQIIRYGQAASVVRVDDPHVIASSIWVSIHGFIQFELRSAQPRTRGRERVDRSYGYLLDLLIRGIQR